MLINILIIVLSVAILILAAGWVLDRIQLSGWQQKLFSRESSSEKITENDLERFPALMKKYLLKVGVVGRSRYANLKFRQVGTIRTDPKRKWLTFKALQYMSAKPGAFVWSARSFPLKITDSYFLGKGKVKVNLLGLLNLAVFSTPETNLSALGRYFGELMWFPIGFLNENIHWEEVDIATVKGTLSIDGLTFTACFHFNEKGLIHSFTGKRYRDLSLDNFRGKAENYIVMDGVLIPENMTAIWDLDSGPMEYYKAKIKDYKILE